MTAGGGVLLVCMPFGNVFSPSIGLSLLKAELAEQGMSVRVRYFSIDFAELVGRAVYNGLSSRGKPSIRDLAGEWIFSGALLGTSVRDDEYVDQILRKRSLGATDDLEVPASPAVIEGLLRARRLVEDFLASCLDDISRAHAKLVGFTSLFQQHVASLALARRVKQSLPETFIVFGGANCEDVMGAETVRQFPFVDAAVSGEADLVFPELARRVLAGHPVGRLSGVRTRDGIDAEFASGRFSHGPMVRDMDSLPYPDYSDYFEQFAASRFGGGWRPRIYLETSRGCWWGERMHCTFCGLNPQTMSFRSKSAQRALDELAWLTERHPGCAIELTDNILDMRYFKDFVPELAARSRGLRLFYEVKSNLRKEQVRMLRDAGIRRIQPGIESFSDPVLRLMRKGVSALQNIQLLKWCAELGVAPDWNLLWGFPGEPPEEYERMARLVPLLTHLPPPNSDGVIRLDRFSPNFEQAERLGFADVTPLAAYRHVYRLPSKVLANLASFFSFRYREPRDVNGYVRDLAKEVRAWRRVAGKSVLFSVDVGECLLVWDLRRASRAPLTVLRGPDRILYQSCDCACDLHRLAESLEQSGEPALAPDAIERRLGPLMERGLLIRDGPRYLALAIPLGEYSPSEAAAEGFYALVRALGTRYSGGWVVAADAGNDAEHARAFKSAKARSRRSASRRRAPLLLASQFSINGRDEVLIRRIGAC